MPVHTMIKEATVLPPPPLPAPALVPKAKTVGTQSDYRESEAQTTPWEPMAVIPEELTIKQQHLLEKHHCKERAELSYLRDLKFGDGLPPGMHEVGCAVIDGQTRPVPVHEWLAYSDASLHILGEHLHIGSFTQLRIPLHFCCPSFCLFSLRLSSHS
jgi:hypothetical protein